jgi:replicative DNA helicase
MDMKIVESNFIFSLYKDPELFDEINFNVNHEYFEFEESKIYFSMIQNMIKQNYKSIDEVSIENYLANKPSTKLIYEEYGGYNTIKEIKNIIDIKNFNKYKDDLIKNNILKKLETLGYNTKDSKFLEMSTTELYGYYEHQLNEVFINTESDIQIQDFNITDTYLDTIDSGKGLGASIANPMYRLNADMGGVRDRNVIIIGAKTNLGKTSFAFAAFVLPLVRQGIKTCIISNEQGLDDFRSIMITSILFTEFKYYKLTRNKIMAGGFDEEQKSMLKKAQEFINKNYTPYLKFVKMFEYDVNNTKKVVKKLSREGFTKFIYDVFKSEDASSSNNAGLMVELSKTLFNLADKLEVSIVMTMQVSLYNNNVRYLTEAHLAGSKQSSEICSQVIMLREVFSDEFANEKFDITPYNYKKDENGHYMKDETSHGIKELFEINPEDRNLIVTLSKNRFGANNRTYVVKHIANYNIFQELGYCEVSHVNRNQ